MLFTDVVLKCFSKVFLLRCCSFSRRSFSNVFGYHSQMVSSRCFIQRFLLVLDVLQTLSQMFVSAVFLGCVLLNSFWNSDRFKILYNLNLRSLASFRCSFSHMFVSNVFGMLFSDVFVWCFSQMRLLDVLSDPFWFVFSPAVFRWYFFLRLVLKLGCF